MSNQTPPPDSVDELIKQALFDYNLNTSLLGNAEDEELDVYVRFIQALITSERKKAVDEVLGRVEKEVIGEVEGIWCDFESDRGTRLCKWCGGYRSAIEHAKWEQHQAIKKLRSEL